MESLSVGISRIGRRQDVPLRCRRRAFARLRHRGESTVKAATSAAGDAFPWRLAHYCEQSRRFLGAEPGRINSRLAILLAGKRNRHIGLDRARIETDGSLRAASATVKSVGVRK